MEQEQVAGAHDQDDRVPLLALVTEYLAITYKHCQQQQQNTPTAKAQQQQQQQQQATANETETDSTTEAPSSSSSRRVLTKKAEPAGNGGLDNVDRNLIVRVRDVLGDDDGGASGRAGKKAASSGSSRANASASGRPGARSRYVVLDLLGQGTFGQVFRCQHADTKQIVAVKVIRNHPSYYKQAIVEVQITQMLNRYYEPQDSPHIVRLLHSFEFQNHLCLVFELLSINVYELISENNFTGFPLEVTQGFLKQILHALAQLSDAGVIHCDLKPENILLAGQDQMYYDSVFDRQHQRSPSPVVQTPLLKVVDFGSACLENETVYSYIQSRFYRSPEVLLGIPYNGAIDMWSLGCIAFEMLLGLPLFPGVSEHDQLCLIEETLGPLPQHLLKKGRNVLKFYDVRIRQRVAGFSSNEQFVLKTPEQFAKEANSEVRIAKKYFKYSKLEDLVHAYPYRESATPGELLFEQERRQAFLHLLNGLLVVDPTARWTAKEALHHPFITGERFVDERAAVQTELPGERAGALAQGRNDSLSSSFYYQQQQMQSAPLHMVTMPYQHHQQQMPLPVHQRVCPVNAYYFDAGDPYYTGVDPASSYSYDQPWTPAYAGFSLGNESSYGYSSSSSLQQPVYEHPSQLQPQFYWAVPPYESFEPPVLPRTKQKVMPVPPTGSAVMPMLHSPEYNFQRLDLPYQQQQWPYTYDPSFMLPLERSFRQPISVAPMDYQQQFCTPPKPNPHHHSNQHNATHKTAAAGHRTARRRRPTQPRIPETGLSLPNLGSSIYQANDARDVSVSAAHADSARHPMPVSTNTASARRHASKSKRRSESKSDDVSDPVRRAWKSPRGASDQQARHAQDRPTATELLVADPEQRWQDGGDTGGQWTPNQVAPQSEDVYFVDGSFDSSAIQYSLATPAPALPI